MFHSLREPVGTIRVILQLCLAVASIFIASCAWAATTIAVPIKEAPIPSDGAGPPRWLDNQHVMFRAFVPGKMIGQEHFYVYDVERGSAAQDSRFPQFYPHVNPDTGVLTAGGIRYENFEDKKGSPILPVPSGTWIDPYSGLPSLKQPPPWVVAGHTSTSKVALKEEDGYLDRGIDGQDTRKNFPILYHRTGIAEPISLGLGSQQVEPRVKYYPFAKGYLLRGERAGNAAPPLWVLHPDGTLEKIFYPDGKSWVDYQWSWFMLTKRGIIFVLMNMRGSDVVGDSGLYLWDGSALRALALGVFESGDVSPDGCKVAVIHNRWKPNSVPGHRFHAQVIDVCQAN